jgi:TRAP-type C4-dicarboxylate transport system permease small subunit
MLFYKLKQRIGKIGGIKILISSIKALIASVIMGVIAYQIIQIKFLHTAVALAISIICAIISFIILLKLLKFQEIEQIFSGMKKKKNAKKS